MTDQRTDGQAGADRLPPGDTGVDVGETGGTGSNGMAPEVGGLGAEGDNTEEATDIANASRGNEAPSG